LRAERNVGEGGGGRLREERTTHTHSHGRRKSARFRRFLVYIINLSACFRPDLVHSASSRLRVCVSKSMRSIQSLIRSVQSEPTTKQVNNGGALQQMCCGSFERMGHTQPAAWSHLAMAVWRYIDCVS